MVAATTLASDHNEIREIALLRPLTADDLRTLPDDGNHYEIIGGELYVSPSPTLWHQMVSAEIMFALQLYLRESGAGRVLSAPMDVHFSQHDIVEPDLLVVLNDNIGVIQRGPWIAGAPDLVVEILSPSSVGDDWVRKSALYATRGVKEYWIVDPMNRAVVVQTLQGGRFIQEGTFGQDSVLQSPLLQGFELELGPIFAELDVLARKPETAENLTSEAKNADTTDAE